jgi:response regulator RpfG family c-di-GMP phosphodiesterase
MNKTKILYVDDESINLMLFEANLEKKYHIFTASDGLSGLNIINSESDIKVVLSDMKMPVMNGLEFIQKARKVSPHICYYILTGFEISYEIQQAINIGIIRRYFKKPFNMNEISSEIETVINGFSK